MPKASICVDAKTPEQELLKEWIQKWKGKIRYLSNNEGCGCCNDLYQVDAPAEVLNELPAKVFASSEWSNWSPKPQTTR
ncbi:hypothetical protein [Coleofasciculus sp. FACHB-1120]|uniref:hypothetical protein n=1 Tax=Coleofasciculus sp. FACHB-1120 TaxID=2692783 RepID=UPI00168A23E7|nr:hypothetical protein [Coleofasciculus sp. FACHB-1120]MBD2744124.1 hypothetical protein [Coleofasciculus sp. FACHB-1120]